MKTIVCDLCGGSGKVKDKVIFRPHGKFEKKTGDCPVCHGKGTREVRPGNIPKRNHPWKGFQGFSIRGNS